MSPKVEVFNDLRRAAMRLPPGSHLSVTAEQAKDLGRLKTKGLRSAGYGEKKAEEVVAALAHGDLGPLGRSLGLELSVE